MSNLNVHQFDGALNQTLIPFRTKLAEISTIDKSIKIKYINDKYIKYPFSPQTINVINIICTSADPANFEPSNNLNALDILYLIFSNWESLDPDFVKNLNEQLSDVTGPNGGLCPSGRTTRIIQLFIQFIDSINMSVVNAPDSRNPQSVDVNTI